MRGLPPIARQAIVQQSAERGMIAAVDSPLDDLSRTKRKKGKAGSS